MQGIYTIPLTENFLDTLAKGVLSRVGDDKESLTQWRILLPTRRAGRELRDAFLRQINSDEKASKRPMLLPTIGSIGDVDADEMDLHLAGYGEALLDVPPAIQSIERLFLLGELTRKKDQHLTVSQSLVQARHLATLIDQVHTEDLDFSRLEDIVPETLSEHWQETLRFLEIVTDSWPAILAERGVIDPADRRNRLMRGFADFLVSHPPPYPILAAGSTGSIPMTCRLLRVISSCPEGAVVLPGLDTEIPEDMWQSISDTHPQATMKNFLEVSGKKLSDVQLWAGGLDMRESRARQNFLRELMAPSDFFARTIDSDAETGMNGLRVIEAANAQEEALVIAIALRDVLEKERKTACFITPDRNLARRVMTALSRWDIAVDDSAGGALAVTPLATFFGSLLRVLCYDFASLPLLDLLKHPLMKDFAGKTVSSFEKDVLRGPRLVGGLEGIRQCIEKIKSPSYALLIDKISTAFHDLQPLATGEHKAGDFVRGILSTAASLISEDTLWSVPESESFALFINSLMSHSDALPVLSCETFYDVYHELLSQQTFRITDPSQRRILFLGQLESRLIRRDVMILGGLNESVWPTAPSFDPWMSRPMRRDFGLPTYDRLVGLSAHDFESHLGAAEVIVTRAVKADGAVTVPARWLQRLRAILISCKVKPEWDSDIFLQYARLIDVPQKRFNQVLPPAPTPPVERRPTQFSATTIERWMRNPYRIYAEKILKLRRIKPIDEDMAHADRGNLVHDVLKEFVETYPTHIPQNAYDILLEKAKEKIALYSLPAYQWEYWWPRFVRIADWFVAHERVWRSEATPWRQEFEASYPIYESQDKSRKFVITAKADRIDILKNGAAAVIDYKTGSVPSNKNVATGKSPQLPIEALLVNRGCYGENRAVDKVMYWHLSGGIKSVAEAKAVRIDIDDAIQSAEEGLLVLIQKFEDTQTPYLAIPATGRMYEDDKAYAHLARVSEWASEQVSDDAPETEGEA